MNNLGLKNICNSIKNEMEHQLDRIGIHYRLFERVKTPTSLKRKIKNKNKESQIDNKCDYYSEEGKKIQDIIGLRIVTYFVEDVNLLWDIFKNIFDKVDESFDRLDKDDEMVIKFMPLRKNMICRFNEDDNVIFKEVSETNRDLFKLVDNTFEIQFRTVLSEGWHEVDHTLRYKCKNEWKGHLEEDRMLNGIYATLETSDRALKALFDDLAYSHYKNKEWQAMLRTKFRLHFKDKELDNQIHTFLNTDRELAKQIYKADREEIMRKIGYSKLNIPISFDNIVYIINHLYLGLDVINNIVPKNISIDLNNWHEPFQFQSL